MEKNSLVETLMFSIKKAKDFKITSVIDTASSPALAQLIDWQMLGLVGVGEGCALH